MVAVDTHQHLWSEPLWEELARRSEVPYVRRHGDRWTLHLPAEPACVMPGPEDASQRTALLDLDAIDLAVVAPSTALGIEWLPRDEAAALHQAHRAGIREAGDRFRRWGTISLIDPDPADLQAELDDEAVGLCLPAGAVGGAQALDRLGPVLEHLSRAGAPLFLHPGPAPVDLAAGAAEHARWSAEPWWWPGLTDYVSTMQRAWLAFAAHGRREHPGLRVLYAMLAGLAPLHAERLAARGAEHLAARALADDHAWYETSSYGPIAQAAVAQFVGGGQLVHGSDRPVVDGPLPSVITPSHAQDHAHALLGKAA